MDGSKTKRLVRTNNATRAGRKCATHKPTDQRSLPRNENHNAGGAANNRPAIQEYIHDKRSTLPLSVPFKRVKYPATPRIPNANVPRCHNEDLGSCSSIANTAATRAKTIKILLRSMKKTSNELITLFSKTHRDDSLDRANTDCAVQCNWHCTARSDPQPRFWHFC